MWPRGRRLDASPVAGGLGSALSSSPRSGPSPPTGVRERGRLAPVDSVALPVDPDGVLDPLVAAAVGIGVGAPDDVLAARHRGVVEPGVELQVTGRTGHLVAGLEAQVVAAIAVGVAEPGVLGSCAVGVGAGADDTDAGALEGRRPVDPLAVARRSGERVPR